MTGRIPKVRTAINLLPRAVALIGDPEHTDGWMFYCHVNDHMMEGMRARYQVKEEELTR